MKIVIVAQHANPPAPASPRPDDAGLSELTRILARQGHRVTVYAQKLSRTRRIAPNSAAACASCTSRSARSASGGEAELLAHVLAFSDPLRARWRRERPDVVHAVSWTSGLAALMATRDLGIPVVQAFSSLGVAERRGPRQRGPGHAAASQAPAGAGHGPTPTVFAGAVTKTARLLANKGPQSTYVRNS